MIRSALLPVLLLASVVPVGAQPAGSPHGELAAPCAACHVEAAAGDRDSVPPFDHDTTGFALHGAHRGVECTACHGSLRFAHVGSLCADCHADVHAGLLGFDCEECHTERGWEDRNRMRERHDLTSFPLRGAHAQADCDACHRGDPAPAYAGTPVDCYACHADAYHATTEPAHEPAGFGHDCTECHDFTAVAWGGDRFLHPNTFPLTGAHARIACASCHTDGFGTLDTACYACHQADYESADDPDHVAATFPLDCAACHTTRAWEPADFDHDATAFALTGAHRTTDCASCHATGYAGTPTDCDACHQADYESADPDHVAAGFPVDCAACHGTGAWEPADWDHDTLFPIYSGRHRNEWDACTDCHVVAADYQVFECIFCHEHSRGETDSDHSDVNDYAYLSTACFECHPRGEDD